MKALFNINEKLIASNKVFLIYHLFNLKEGESASITDYINELNMITIQLTSKDILFEDVIKVLILLPSLIESWSTIVTVVSNSLSSTKLKLSFVQDLILS